MSDPLVDIIREQQALARRIGQTEVREAPAPLAARYATASGQSIANNTITIVDYGTLIFDTHSRVTTGANWKFTANVAGYYGVSAAILYTTTTTWADTDAGNLYIYLNGAQYSFLDRKDSYGSASSVFMRLGGMDTIQLTVGDYIDIRTAQTSGAALALHNVAAFNYVNVWRL